MNRDFTLDATPGRARIIIRLAEISEAHIDPNLRELAATGLAPIDDQFTPDEKSSIQHILDTGMRCVVPGPMVRSVDMIIEAARHDGVEKIIVLGTNRQWWNSHEALNKSGIAFEFVKLTPTEMDSDFVRENRHHLLVFEPYPYGTSEQTIFAHSFPKVIAIENFSGVSRLKPVIHAIFPRAPVELLDDTISLQRNLTMKGFKATKSSDLAFLLNVITDHLRVR